MVNNTSSPYKISAFNLILLELSLMLSVTWMVWQRLVFNTPGAWLIHVSLGSLVFLVLLKTNREFARLIVRPPFIFIGLWGLFNAVNMMFIDEWHEKGSIANLLYPYVFACLAAFAVRADPAKTMKCLLGAMLFYLAIFLSNSEMHMFSDAERLIASNFNSNEIAQICVVTIVLLSIMKFLRGKIIIWQYMLMGMTSIFLVLLGSRNAAICGFLILFAFFTLKIKSSSFSTLKLLIFLLLFIYIAYMVLSYTELGIRFRNVAEESDVNTFWSRMLGERYYYYILGTDLFLKKPWTGCGFRNFIQYNPRGFSCHAEYIAQLAEGGIISFILFFAIFVPMLIKSAVCQMVDKKRTNMYLSFMLLLSLMIFCIASIISFKLDMYIILVMADYLYNLPSAADEVQGASLTAPMTSTRKTNIFSTNQRKRVLR